jgi:hypothetical protein
MPFRQFWSTVLKIGLNVKELGYFKASAGFRVASPTQHILDLVGGVNGQVRKKASHL